MVLNSALSVGRFIYIYLHLFTFIYIYLHLFTFIYIYLHLFTFIYQWLSIKFALKDLPQKLQLLNIDCMAIALHIGHSSYS